MIDTIVPLLLVPINYGSSGISIIPPTHRPPLCQANHCKPLAASGWLLLFRRLLVPRLPGPWLPEWWLFSLAVPVDGFGFGGGWFRGFSAAGYATSDSATAGLMAAGFEVLDLVVAGLAAVGFKQCQVHCPDAA